MTPLADPRNGPAFDLPACTGSRVYVIASTPRTGSTLLARVLWDLGGLGAPKEYLNPTQIRDWEVRFGGPLSRRVHGWLRGPAVQLAGRRPWSDRRLGDHLDRVRRLRSSGGWFGMKIHWHHHQRFFGRRSMESWLGPIHWIRIRRRDRLGQAVSWLRAIQSGAWVANHPTRMQPLYSRALITARMAEIEAAEAGWDGLLSGSRVHEVAYEDLVSDPERSIAAVVAFLGSPRALDGVDLPLQRQADAITVAWMERYAAGE